MSRTAKERMSDWTYLPGNRAYEPLCPRDAKLTQMFQEAMDEAAAPLRDALKALYVAGDAMACADMELTAGFITALNEARKLLVESE